MNDNATYVIVGASLAGAKAAETLRAEGFGGRIILLGAETHRPYERPPLSKQLLRREITADGAFVHDEAFYAENDIDLRLETRATHIDIAARTVEIEARERVAYDRLLLTTGARPRRLMIPGSDLDGIHYLRDLDHNRALRNALRSASRVAVVGGGWIGSEVAASIRQLGLEVALIHPGPAPLTRVLGAEVASVFRDLHLANGVELHAGTMVAGFVGQGHAVGIRTDEGASIETDLVVVGVGVEPRIELAVRAGLAIDNGIATDQFLETSAPGVFAAGDVAAAWHPRLERRIRVEHWANATNQGAVAAKNMLGMAIPYDRVPYFFSDQFDLGMEYSGHTPTWDRVVFRGDPTTNEFVVFWIAGERVVAAMNVNVWDVVDSLQELIVARQPVVESHLIDAGIPIAALTSV